MKQVKPTTELQAAHAKFQEARKADPVSARKAWKSALTDFVLTTIASSDQSGRSEQVNQIG